MERREVVDARWVDNGPGWLGLLSMGGAEQVLGLEAARIDQSVGAVGHHPDGSEAAFEVRAFLPATGGWTEDPVTRSLNASVAEWPVAAGRAHPPYVVTQGARVGAAGRVRINEDSDAEFWVGGHTVTAIKGSAERSG